MKYHKVVLAGGNGYLGTVFSNYYAAKSDEVIILSRTPKATCGNIKTIVWDGQNEGEWTKALDGAEMLVNLCGKNVNCRYTESNRTAIISSRKVPTKLLGKTIQHSSNPPKLWINVTSARIYRHAEDRPQDEITGEIGEGFSIDVCNIWERTFNEIQTPHTRKIALRMGIVLGSSDGVFPRLLNLVKLGMGGKQGNGKQYVSWIHEVDAARSTEWLLDHPEMAGVFNCTAPVAIQNASLMNTIRKTYKMPFGLPAPAWLLEIGAIVIGTETELILKSRWVVPQKLLNSGFDFEFATADEAVKAIYNRSTSFNVPRF
jgi:uncharacterized protein (TIGR01777 family)